MTQTLVITYTFPRCWVHVDEGGSFLHTAFDSGRTLEAVPNPIKDGETALRYGYGDNIWQLWREHDVLHHTVGTLFGHGVSPTIWTVAHEELPGALPRWAQKEEEAFIAHIHRWLNHGAWHAELGSLENLGRSRHEMKAVLRAVLNGELLDCTELMPRT